MSNQDFKQRQIKGLLYKLPSYDVQRYLFNIDEIYKFDLVQMPSSVSSEIMFQTWLKNDFDLPMSAVREPIKYYKDISNSELYENASQNEEIFRRAFIVNVKNFSYGGLERAWMKKVTEYNESAQNLGERFYVESALDYASDKGYFQGYQDVYRNSSVDAFQSNYGSYFSEHFSSIEQHVRTTSNLANIEAEIILAVPEKEMAAGDVFGVRVNSIINRGMVAGQAVVSVPDQANVKKIERPTVLISVNGLTKNNDSKIITPLGWISDIKSPDQRMTLQVAVHDQVFQKEVTVAFESLIKRATNTTNEELRKYLMSRIVTFMKKQWDEISGFRDQFADRDILLVRMRKLFDSLSENQKQILRHQGQMIRNIFGEKPIRFLNPKRDDWDEAQHIMREMGLEGKVPDSE